MNIHMGKWYRQLRRFGSKKIKIVKEASDEDRFIVEDGYSVGGYAIAYQILNSVNDLVIGETYKLRDDLKVGEKYGGHVFVQAMAKEAKILTVINDDIHIDSSGYIYTIEMFKGYERKNEFVGKRYKMRDDLVTSHPYGGLAYWKEMYKDEVVIYDVREDNNYIVKGNSNNRYTMEMFDYQIIESYHDLIIGTVHELKSDLVKGKEYGSIVWINSEKLITIERIYHKFFTVTENTYKHSIEMLKGYVSADKARWL